MSEGSRDEKHTKCERRVPSFRQSVWILVPATFQVNPSPHGHLPTQRSLHPRQSHSAAGTHPRGSSGCGGCAPAHGGEGVGPPEVRRVSELRVCGQRCLACGRQGSRAYGRGLPRHHTGLCYGPRTQQPQTARAVYQSVTQSLTQLMTSPIPEAPDRERTSNLYSVRRLQNKSRVFYNKKLGWPLS